MPRFTARLVFVLLSLVFCTAFARAQTPPPHGVQAPDWPNITVPMFYPYCQQRPPGAPANDPYITNAVWVSTKNYGNTTYFRGYQVARDIANKIRERLQSQTPDLAPVAPNAQ